MMSPAGSPLASRSPDPYRYGDTIHDVFDYRVACQPLAPALVTKDQVITYRDLAAAADVLAASLAASGVGPGHFALVRMRRSPVFAAVLLAILKLGAAYLAAEQAWPTDYVQGILDRADAWLVSDDPADGLASPRGAPVVPADALPQGPALPWPKVGVAGTAPCTIFQTSGSTGLPKLAVVPHRATVRAFIGVDYADFGPGHVIVQTSPVCWDVLTLELWSVLLSGGTSLIPPEGSRMGGDLLRSCSAEYGLDTVWLTSSLFSALVDDDLDSFAGIRQVMSGGERVSVDHVRRLLSAHPGMRFSSGYGPVETTVFATSYTESGNDLDQYEEVPLGRPMPATTVLVLDDHGAPCPPGKTGEIHVGGDALGLGYLADPAETRRRFVDGPDGGRFYRTGDLGVWHETGVLLFRGRMDRQLKIRGQRVEPEEVERFISGSFPGVVVAVTPLADPHGLVTGLAAHCGTGARAVTAADIRSACDTGLPPHLRPRRVFVHAELPRTDNGKVDRAALDRAVAVAAADRMQAPSQRPAGGSAADLIAWVASSLLGTDVTAADDLFDLGGDSLFAMRLAARLRREEGISLTVGQIHRERTIARLAGLTAVDPAGQPDGHPVPEAGSTWVLSLAEEDLCLHEVIFPGDPALLLVSAYEWSDDIDLASFRQALVLTCARHPALSAARILEGNQIRAHARTPDQIGRQLQVHHSDDVLAEADGGIVLPAGWLTSFDLASDLPLRVYLARRPGGRLLLGLVMHHVAMDGWSEHLFVAEVSAAYGEMVGVPGDTPRLPRMPVSPPPAAGPAELDRARDYWRALLTGVEPLPVSLAQPGVNTFAQTSLMLTQAQCAALAALSGGHPDLHAGLLAWYADALGHTFHQPSFAIGSAYAARDLAGENAIGFHVQMVPLRIDYLPGKTLTDLAPEISRQWLESLDQRSLPMRQIAACEPGARTRGGRPVFQAGFALQQDPPHHLRLAGDTLKRVPVHPPASPFELYLEVWPHPDGHVAHLQWDKGCVPDTVSQQIADRLRTTAASLAETTSVD
jgi:amino acid adenylation domain-containing protein